MLKEKDYQVIGKVEGERNEPSNVRLAVEKISEICEVDKVEVRKDTYDNEKKVINL